MAIKNDIISTFDNEKNDKLKVKLKTIEDMENGLVLELSGEIDSYNPMFLQKKVSKVVASNYVKLIFDCRDLTDISSAGVGAFTAFIRLVKPHGGDIVLICLIEKVFNLFRLLGFSQFFEIRENLREAISYFRKPAKALDLSSFPRLIPCPTCARQLKIERPGRFRCTECKTILAIDGNAQLFLG